MILCRFTGLQGYSCPFCFHSLCFSSLYDIQLYSQPNRSHLRYSNDPQIPLYCQMKNHSWYTRNLVQFLTSIQLSVHYFEWMMLEKLLSKSNVFLIFYFIPFPIHYIKKVCSNISQVRKTSAT